MNKLEFEGLIGKEVTNDEFNVIDRVYSYHPAISSDSVDAKKQVAAIYSMFGMVVFYDMLDRAEKVADCDMRLRLQRSKVVSLQKELEMLRKGRCF